MKWPKKIKPNSQVHSPLSLMDFLPTLLDAVQEGFILPKVCCSLCFITFLRFPFGNHFCFQIDGESFLPQILGLGLPQKDRIIRHYCGTSLQALRIVQTGGKIYKVYRHLPILNDQGHCGSNCLCPCFGPGVKELKEFMAFDLTTDPTEERPLDNKRCALILIFHWDNKEWEQKYYLELI